MMGWTDRHARYFLRQISSSVLLYTEMVTTGALINSDVDYHLAYNDIEHPLALQLGGSDPGELARCARLAEDYSYDEVNLNIGCPSDRVQSGRFGACLMQEPGLVADCVAAMREAVSIPVTVKCRTGVDQQEDYDTLASFIRTVAQAGCQHFIVHARNAWLQGLSPKQNRDIPPLKYEYVYRLKQDFPSLSIAINGGIKTLPDVSNHLEHVDSVMIGREAYHHPYILAEIDTLIYKMNTPVRSRQNIVESMLDYTRSELQAGQSLHAISRHMLGLYAGCPGAKNWRRMLSDHKQLQQDDETLLLRAASLIR